LGAVADGGSGYWRWWPLAVVATGGGGYWRHGRFHCHSRLKRTLRLSFYPFSPFLSIFNPEFSKEAFFVFQKPFQIFSLLVIW